MAVIPAIKFDDVNFIFKIATVFIHQTIESSWYFEEMPKNMLKWAPHNCLAHTYLISASLDKHNQQLETKNIYRNSLTNIQSWAEVSEYWHQGIWLNMLFQLHGKISSIYDNMWLIDDILIKIQTRHLFIRHPVAFPKNKVLFIVTHSNVLSLSHFKHRVNAFCCSRSFCLKC